MKAPVCSLNASAPTEQSVPPTGSQVEQRTSAHYASLIREAGVLNTAQEMELFLQKDFVSSVSNLASAVPAVGAYNRIESAMATLLGWKRWLWQSEKTGTGAGLVRETLLERSTAAAEMVRMVALNKALPDIQRLQKLLLQALPELPRARVLELLHDQVVVGNYSKILNIVDSPLVMERISQRALKHESNLVEAGVNEETRGLLTELSLKISQTFDETRYAAANSGFNVELMQNGGYFPLRATPEFDKYLSEKSGKWLAGYKSTKELAQLQRKSNVPVVVDLDRMAQLLHNQLLNKPLQPDAIATYTKKELETLAEKVTAAKEVAASISEKQQAKLEQQQLKLARSLEVKHKAAVNSTEALLKQKDKTALAQLKGELDVEQYTKAEQRAILAAEESKLTSAREAKLAEVDSKWDLHKQKQQELLTKRSNAETSALIKKTTDKQSVEVQKVLDHEKAKLALLQLNSDPHQLSKFLASNFNERQLKRLFEGGYLSQLPAMTDELLQVYRGLDTGVRGLSDALVLDPVQAIKGYANELSKAAEKQQLFKTAFDQGAEAGWVKATITAEEAKSYIKVGSSAKLRQFLPTDIAKETSDMYIHKAAAEQLNALLKINTSPGELNHAAQSFQMFTSAIRKSLIVGGLDSYVKRVFVQDIISLHAATGSLVHLPMALVDVFRHMSGQWDSAKDVAKVFKIGEHSYTKSELLREVAARRGNFAASSMHDPRNLLDDVFSRYSSEAKERAAHFNSLHTKKFGNPLTGAVAKGAALAGEAFNKSYGLMAFANSTLDSAARWAAVKDLASSGRFDTLDELLRHLDTYFSINADGGAVGQALGNFYMPFAQFAINSPGAALRHALNYPWRTANVMHLYAQATNQQSISEAETPAWLRESEDYFFSMYSDPDTGKRGIVMPQNVDFMLDSYTWMTSLARDVAGSPRTLTGYVDSEVNPMSKVQKAVADLIGKNYVANSALALIGINPKSLKPYDKAAPADTLLGVSTPVGIRTMLTNLVPVLRKLDAALPTSIVGRAPATGSLFGSVQFTKDAGEPGWTGATPTTGGTRPLKEQPEFARLFEALTGVTVTQIDPQQNLISTYKDLASTAADVRRNRMALYRRMTQTGVKPTEQEYERFDHLKQLEVVLMSNKMRIDALAVRKGLTPPVLYEQLQGSLDSAFEAPLDNDTTLELIRTLQTGGN